MNLAEVVTANDEKALAAAIQRSRTEAPNLAEAIAGNEAITAALSSAGVQFAATDVLAIDVPGDGTVTLFYWKKK